MRDRFMLIGTLEEAEYNGVVRQLKAYSTRADRQFAGRNWNHGQVSGNWVEEGAG